MHLLPTQTCLRYIARQLNPKNCDHRSSDMAAMTSTNQSPDINVFILIKLSDPPFLDLYLR